MESLSEYFFIYIAILLSCLFFMDQKDPGKRI